MDEDELLDEDDVVDGASDGSDDAARMGIQTMQVDYVQLLQMQMRFCHLSAGMVCCKVRSWHAGDLPGRCACTHNQWLWLQVHEVQLGNDRGSDVGTGAAATPAPTAAAAAVSAAAAAEAAGPGTAVPAAADQPGRTGSAPAGAQAASR